MGSSLAQRWEDFLQPVVPDAPAAKRQRTSGSLAAPEFDLPQDVKLELAIAALRQAEQREKAERNRADNEKNRADKEEKRANLETKRADDLQQLRRPPTPRVATLAERAARADRIG